MCLVFGPGQRVVDRSSIIVIGSPTLAGVRVAPARKYGLIRLTSRMPDLLPPGRIRVEDAGR